MEKHADGDGHIIRRLVAAMGLFAAAFCICWYIAGQVYLHNMTVVNTVRVGEGSLQKRESYIGTVSFGEPSQQISFGENVEVTKVRVKAGALVEQGQVLLEYTCDETELRIRQLEQQMAREEYEQALSEAEDDREKELFSLYLARCDRELKELEAILGGEGKLYAPVTGRLVYVVEPGMAQAKDCLAEVAASAEPELILTYLRGQKYPLQAKTFRVLSGEREFSFEMRGQESRIDGMAEVSGAIPFSEWGSGAFTGSEVSFEQVQSDRYSFTLPGEAVNRTSETTGEVWVVVAAASWLGEDEWELAKWSVRILDSGEECLAISDRITDPVVRRWDSAYTEGMKVRMAE